MPIRLQALIRTLTNGGNSMSKKAFAANSLIAGLVIGTGYYHARRYIAHTASNTEHMYDSIRYGLSLIKRKFKLTKLCAGKYTDMTMYRLFKFHVERYRIEGIGNLSVMSSKMTTMQMSTFVITPFESNLPLASFDLMYTLGKRKFIIEFYDVADNRDSEEYQKIIAELKATGDGFSDLEDIPPRKDDPEWLDKCRSVKIHKQIDIKDDARAILLFTRTLNAYLEAAKHTGALSPADRETQLVCVREYVDNMLEESGVSTAMFKKAYAPDITRDFFGKVFFGCDNVTTEI